MSAAVRAKAQARGLTNLEFREGDLLNVDAAGITGGFDAVVCVFGVFFVPDTTAAMRALWQQVAPGGRLAITTWGPRFLEPGSSLFWDAIRAERPDLDRGFNPWDRITEPDAVRALFTDAGIGDPHVVA